MMKVLKGAAHAFLAFLHGIRGELQFLQILAQAADDRLYVSSFWEFEEDFESREAAAANQTGRRQQLIWDIDAGRDCGEDRVFAGHFHERACNGNGYIADFDILAGSCIE